MAALMSSLLRDFSAYIVGRGGFASSASLSCTPLEAEEIPKDGGVIWRRPLLALKSGCEKWSKCCGRDKAALTYLGIVHQD